MSVFRVLLVIVFAVVLSSAGFAENEDNELEGGILGTGIQGTVTALGSIYVNGQHILFDPALSVTGGGPVEKATDLRPGHTVAVIATRENAQWRASEIRQVLPLVGPVRKTSEGTLEVMGSAVIANDAMAGDIHTGDWIAVSGLWQSGNVIATRIDRVSLDSRARIEGTAIGIVPGQPLKIGGTAISGILPSHIQEGDVVRVFGNATADSLRAEHLETGVFDGTPQVTFSEGYFSSPTPKGLYTLLGSDIVSYTDNPTMINPEARQFVCRREGMLYSIRADQSDAGHLADILTDCLSSAVE